MKITLLGAGAWGTALAIAFSGKHEITLWSIEDDVLDDLRNTRENQRFFPGYYLPEQVNISGDFTESVSNAELLIISTPIAGLRPTLERLKNLNVTLPILWVCKGFEAGTGKLPHQVVLEVMGEASIFGVLSGPSFAEEVAAGQPTAITLASNNHIFSCDTARELHTSRLRVYANDDLIGVEVGGAVKNVMAIAAGVCDGLRLGLNSRAALITRGLAEIARLGIALGAHRETFMGLAGMGDLILTCTGDLSRNRRVGLALAENQSLAQILETLGHVAEGVHTAREVDLLANRLNVDMPISAAVAAVLDGRLNASEALEQLMSRRPKEELT